ncbi:hypothetical protein BB560_002932, partial [Smittium megazygosporum]
KNEREVITTSLELQEENKKSGIFGFSTELEDISVTPSTRILYTNESFMIQKVMLDSLFSEFSVVLIEVPIQRSANIDLLIFLFKRALKAKKDFRLILLVSVPEIIPTFLDYFAEGESSRENIISVVEFDEELDNVDTHYLESPNKSYFEAAIETVKKIHENEDDGDILVFFPGRNEVDNAVNILSEYKLLSLANKSLEAYSLHSGVSPNDVNQIVNFSFTDRRKVIFSTNVAENIEFISGIRYVIDTGLKKERVFDNSISGNKLELVSISKASASLRLKKVYNYPDPAAIRKCYRLYPFSFFSKVFPKLDCPEIYRLGGFELAEFMIKLFAIKNQLLLENTIDMIKPGINYSNLPKSMELLESLGCFVLDTKEHAEDNSKTISEHVALNGSNKGTSKLLDNEVIKRLFLFNIDPQLGVCILAAFETREFENDSTFKNRFLQRDFNVCEIGGSVNRLDISVEMTIIAVMSSMGDVFYESNDERSKRKFSVLEGDHLTLLNVFLAFFKEFSNSKNQERLAYFCKKHSLVTRKMFSCVKLVRKIISVYLNRQVTEYDLINIVEKYVLSSGYSVMRKKSELIRRCLVRGLSSNIAQLQGDNSSFKNLVTNQVMYIHPKSTLFHSVPKFIVYSKLIETTKVFMVDVSVIEEEWPSQIVPNMKFVVLPPGFKQVDVEYEVTCIKSNYPMNLIGNTVKKAVSRFNVNEGSLVVVSDNLDQPVGKYKMKYGGSASGHNGIKSIIQKLGTDAKGNERVAKHVLTRFKSQEFQEIEQAADQIVESWKELIIVPNEIRNLG